MSTTTATLSTHSALETLMMTTTPQLMKNDRNTANSETKNLREITNSVDANNLQKHTSKSSNEFTVSYANSRLGSKMVDDMTSVSCSNLDVQTPTKALFTNQDNEQEQHEQELYQEKEKEIEQEKQCLEENVNEHMECETTSTEKITNVNFIEEAKEVRSNNSNSNKKECNSKCSGNSSKVVEHALTMTQKLMEEPSALLFLTPTYRNKIYAALQQINNDADMNAINSGYVMTSSEERNVDNMKHEELYSVYKRGKVNNQSSNTISDDHNNCNHEDVNVESGSSEKNVNWTNSIYNLTETGIYSHERQEFTAEEVYKLLKNALSNFELQRDEEEANVLSHLRTEMDALERKYELLCVEQEKTEKEKQLLERELKRVITTLEEVLKNKVSEDADKQQHMQQTQHLLTEKEEVICELKDKMEREQQKNKLALPLSVHDTSDIHTELLPSSPSEVISKKQCAKDALTECTMEHLNEEVTSMPTVNEIMSKMNEMHYGMTEMESTLKEQQARIEELEIDLQNKENEFKELKRVNTELQQVNGKFNHNNNKSDQYLASEIAKLQVTINAQRKEMQTQTRKLIALQNERTIHISFSRDLESFTQMLLQEQSEIYTKLAKLSNNSVNKTSSKLLKMTALLYKKCTVTKCQTEYTDEADVAANCYCDENLSINVAGTNSTSLSSANNTANSWNSVNKAVTECESREHGEVGSFDDVNRSATSSSSTTTVATNTYEFANSSSKRQNISGKMSKAIRLLEVRRRAIARVVQQIERQLLSLMVTCDKAQHYCYKMAAQQLSSSSSPPSNAKENNYISSEETNKLVCEKQSETSKLHQKSTCTFCSCSSRNNNKHSISESNANVTSPSPHRPSSNKEAILHSESSACVRRNTYNGAIQLCSSSEEEYSSTRHGLSASQEGSHNEINRSIYGDSSIAINNVHSNRVNSYLPRRSTNQHLQIDVVLDGGSLCPLPPPRLRVCDEDREEEIRSSSIHQKQ